jgi:hypothetical protein
MRRYIRAALAAVFLLSLGTTARPNDQDANSILDKAIKALGGADKLAAAKSLLWKSKGTITLEGEDRDMNSTVTVQGLDHFRREFGNDQFSGVVVLAGDKGWRRFGDNQMDLDGDALANEKRNVYLQVAPITLVPLKGNGFKCESSGEEKVGDKTALVLKITAADGKDFTLAFDKESGMPIRLVAKVIGFQGQEFTAETTYADYKDFGGIKKATKIEIKRDGEKFQSMEITEFKVLDKADPETFTEPK